MTRLTKLLRALPIAALFVACQDAQAPTSPSKAIPVAPPASDIAQGGANSSFTFLPPLVQAPAREGTFDNSKNPLILVCELTGSTCDPRKYIAFFMRTMGTTKILVDDGDEAYAVNWNTQKWNLDASKIYRLRVFVDGREMGHVDLDAVANEAEAAGVDRNNFAPVVVGSTLAIRFKFVSGSTEPELGSIHGRVVDADTDAPLAGATVSSGTRSTVSGEDGTFSLQLPAGARDVTFGHDGYVTRVLEDVDVASGATEELGDVELEPEATEPENGTVHGRVIDADTEEPIAGASVATGGREAITGQDGTFSLELAPGTHDLDVSKSGYVTKSVDDVDVVAGETTELDDVELTPVAVGGLSLNAVRVGSGLMVLTSGGLGSPASGALTLRIESSNPSKVLVSRTSADVGAASVELPITAGAITFTYWVHAIGGQTGTATLTASATGYTDATETATIVQPQLHFVSLPSEASATGANVPFRVRVDAAASATDQLVRRGGGSYAVTVSSSSAATGKVLTSSDDEGSVTVQIAEGQNMSPETVAGGGVAFDPIAQGTTTVTAAATGAVSGTRQVVVTGGGALTVRDTTVGGGLQYQTRVIFSTEEHAALTLRLESADPSKLLLSRFGTTAGTAVLEIEVSSGSPQVTFYVQAIEGKTGTVKVTASAPGFGSDEGTMTIVRPTLQLTNVQPSISAAGGNQVFRVRAELPSSNIIQQARFGGGGFPITLTSSNGTAAHIAVTGGSTGASVTARIPGGELSTPFSGANSLFIDPRAAGTTTIAVSSEFANGDSEQTQIVGGAVVIANDTVGGGLEEESRVTLPTGAHGGVTVTVTSSDPSKVLLRRTNGTVGSASIEIPVGDGSTTAFFWVQGVKGTTGTSTLTATATGFANDDATIRVVQPAVRLLGLFDEQTVSLQSGLWSIRAQVGIMVGANLLAQEVAVGTSALTATITNSNTTTARLTGSGASAGSATLQIQPGQYLTPAVNFEPLAAGTTTVDASVATFLHGALATADVKVVDNTWRSSATQYRSEPVGTRHTYVCPANPPADQRTSSVWGTDIYTDDSSVCRAAVHAGKITYAAGGSVTFELLGAQTSFTGSTRNGVTTFSYPSWPRAFRFP